jgi:hypothetical protein
LNAGFPAFCAPYGRLPELRKRVADVGERKVYGCRDGFNARDERKCNQGAQQCIFDQILTSFAIRQILEIDIQLQKQVIHFDLSGNRILRFI